MLQLSLYIELHWTVIMDAKLLPADFFHDKLHKGNEPSLDKVLYQNVLNSRKPSNMHSLFNIKVWKILCKTCHEIVHISRHKRLYCAATSLKNGILVIDKPLHQRNNSRNLQGSLCTFPKACKVIFMFCTKIVWYELWGSEAFFSP